MKDRVVNVTDFKAHCLALLDDIGKRGGTITVTKRGKPLAKIGPAEELAWKSPEGAWAGKISAAVDAFDLDITSLWEVSDPKARDRI
jgi:prevent-host-death family protein